MPHFYQVEKGWDRSSWNCSMDFHSHHVTHDPSNWLEFLTFRKIYHTFFFLFFSWVKLDRGRDVGEYWSVHTERKWLIKHASFYSAIPSIQSVQSITINEMQWDFDTSCSDFETQALHQIISSICMLESPSLLSLSTAYPSFVAHFPTVSLHSCLAAPLSFKKAKRKIPPRSSHIFVNSSVLCLPIHGSFFSKTNRFYCLTKKTPSCFLWTCQPKQKSPTLSYD